MSYSHGHPIDLAEQIRSLAADPLTFPQLLARLYAMRYQGPLTLHFAAGIPRQVVLDQPIRVTLETKRLTGEQVLAHALD